MKSLKHPLNMSFTKRIVYSYAALLSLLSIFILINPVLAQEDEPDTNNPKVHIDIKKQFDEESNLTRYDSTYSWYWSGRDFPDAKLDSLFRNLNQKFHHFWDEEFMEQFSEQQENFRKRYNDYIEEHQKLIDKYFRTPYDKKDSIPEAKPNKYIPPEEKKEKTKSARI
ncbi:MAG: hypothetical protein H8D45_32515 [Bacteroidetes bacterium]|nr:hypothetical protein [Bacteroidota bacterium]MBL7103115.1 hypothetical protein [Bacteroidales bacterium]